MMLIYIMYSSLPSDSEPDTGVITARWRVFMLNKNLHTLRSARQPHDEMWQEKESRCLDQLASAKEELASLELGTLRAA